MAFTSLFQLLRSYYDKIKILHSTQIDTRGLSVTVSNLLPKLYETHYIILIRTMVSTSVINSLHGCN